ncbi:hypothetical protein IG631_23640 [Alternaria alternata]|nr:hypothetical protein IG631_23640 [Alternaria alternata]
MYVQKLSTKDYYTRKLSPVAFVWTWDEGRFSRVADPMRAAVLHENGLDDTKMTDLAAVRGVDARPYIVEEYASRRVVALRVVDSREGVMVVKRRLEGLQRWRKASSQGIELAGQAEDPATLGR